MLIHVLVEESEHFRGRQFTVRPLLESRVLPHLACSFHDFRKRKRPATGSVSINFDGFGRRDELHFGKSLDETDVVLKDLESPGRLLGRFGGGKLPLFARRVGALAEIDAVPKLLVNELARVIKDADDAAAFG